MPTDLIKFIELLYAVVVGFAFSEIYKGRAFKDMLAGIVRPRDLIYNFSLITALMIFIISDYTVFMWAAYHGGEGNTNALYKTNYGAVMFLVDFILLSFIYLLTTIACLEASPRRLHSFLLFFVLFHLLVTVWWVLDGLRSGKGAFSSIPLPHIIRASIYLFLLLAYRIAVWKNIGGLKKGFETDSLAEVKPVILETIVLLVTLIIGVSSFLRFLEFHKRIFSK